MNLLQQRTWYSQSANGKSETQAKCSLILLVKSSLCCAATSRLTSFIVVSWLHVALCQIVLWSYIYEHGPIFLGIYHLWVNIYCHRQWSRLISNTLGPATSVWVLVVILTTISSAFLFFDFKSLNLFFGCISTVITAMLGASLTSSIMSCSLVHICP